MKRTLKDAQDPDVLFFASKDEAFEWCEDRILTDAGRQLSNDPVDLRSQCLLKNMAKDDIERIKALTVERTYQAGETIFSVNDPADRLYFIRSGDVSIELTVVRSQTRLAQPGPGMTFGELAFVENGTRTANAKAKTTVTCYELNRQDFETELPVSIRYKLLNNVCELLAKNLRTANKEISALI